MPAQTLPLDDNTLFILLALRYQGQIKIQGLDSVYDELVNYDYTRIKRNDNRCSVEEIAGMGLDWIHRKFKVQQKIDENGTIILTSMDNKQLRAYLNKYFKIFRTYENYYLDETKHEEQFANFIKQNYEDIVEYKKFFLYRITPNTQYKMIQYIGYLLDQRILVTEENAFRFNNGGRGYKKVVQVKFANEYNINKFLELGQKKTKGRFFIHTKNENVYFVKPDGEILDFAAIGLTNRMRAILWLCIYEDLTELSVATYQRWQNKKRLPIKGISNKINSYRINRYFNDLKKEVKNLTQIDVIGEIQKGIRILNFG